MTTSNKAAASLRTCAIELHGNIAFHCLNCHHGILAHTGDRGQCLFSANTCYRVKYVSQAWQKLGFYAMYIGNPT